MADPEDPGTPRELEARVDELQRRVERLEARLQASPAADSPPPTASIQPPPPAAPSYWLAPNAQSGTAPPAPTIAAVQPSAAVAPATTAGSPTRAADAGPAAPVTGWTTGPSGPTVLDRVTSGGLEELLTGRVLAWVGGGALIAGAILFLSLAFSRGWIGPEARVILGLVGGSAALVVGAWLFAEARQRQLAHVLVAVGLGVVSVALIAATRLYDLVPVEVGLAGSLVVAVVAAAIAIRANAQAVAAFGLLAVLAAPPAMGASPDLLTIAFLATALVGTTVIALFRSWPVLPAIAFLLSAPQLASWLVAGDTVVAVGLVVLWAYWLINEIAAAGEESLRRTRDLSPTSATLVLADAAFLIAGGFALLDGPFEIYRGVFLLAVALAHLAVGAWFLRTDGDQHPFGLLVTGTALAALTMAVPVQFGASVVPVAWAAEAVALTWIRVRRDHRWSGVAALVLGTLAVGHLALVEMPLRDLPDLVRPSVPFADPAGLAALFVIAALALSAWFLVILRERAGVISVAILVGVYVLPFELTGVAVLVGWAAIGVGAIWLDQRVLQVGRPVWSVLTARSETVLSDLLESSVWYAGLIALLAAVGHALAVELPLDDLPPATLPAIPFVDPGGVAIVALAAAALAIAWIDPRRTVRVVGALSAGAIVAYGVVFQVPLAAAIVIWSASAVVYARIASERPDAEVWWIHAADLLVGLGLLVALGSVAPLDRLVVDAGRPSPAIPFLNGATVAIAALATALGAVVWLNPHRRWTAVREGAAAILVVYLLSIGVVDLFQARLGSGVAEEELAKQAQVALSVLWGVLGVGAFAFGLIADRPRAREAGLGLLALVTAKVLLVDLAALDVAYRVLSLLALGIVLLASAYLSGRFRRVTPAG